jgi:hypothetical protein
MNRHAGVAWHDGHMLRENQTRDHAARGISKGRNFGKKCRPKSESIKGIRIQGLKKQLYLKSERTAERIFGKTSYWKSQSE